MNLKCLESLYDEVLTETKNFNDLIPDVILENPKRLVIFRLIKNMDQRSFGNMLGISQGTIYAIENDLRKTVKMKVIEGIFESLRGVKIPDKKTLLNRYDEISLRGKFHGEYARKMSLLANKNRSIKGAVLKPPTDQEGEFIRRLQETNMDFKFHGIVKTSREFVVDFIFPSEINPRLILEVKDLKHNFRKRQSAIQLAYESLKIRQKYPEIKLLAAINGKWENDAINIIKEEYDYVLLNKPVEEVIELIRNFL